MDPFLFSAHASILFLSKQSNGRNLKYIVRIFKYDSPAFSYEISLICFRVSCYYLSKAAPHPVDHSRMYDRTSGTTPRDERDRATPRDDRREERRREEREERRREEREVSSYLGACF